MDTELSDTEFEFLASGSESELPVQLENLHLNANAGASLEGVRKAQNGYKLVADENLKGPDVAFGTKGSELGGCREGCDEEIFRLPCQKLARLSTEC